VANPIAMMTAEHDAAHALIAEIHQLSNTYTTPVGACPTYHAFYDGLKEFEQDLHQHIHLENDILFPRAIQLETGATLTNT
jgi:regulator of cell morphogenesis and NO signaling